MAKLNPATMYIDKKTFPANLNVLDFIADKPFEVTLKVGDSVIYKVTLQPDAKGEASLYSLADLFQTHLLNVPQTVDILLDGISVAQTTCYPCNVLMTMTADDFLAHNFMQLSKGALDTYPGSIELLSFAADNIPQTMSVVSTFVKPDGSLVGIISGLNVVASENGVWTVAIDVDQIIKGNPDDDLVEIEARVGNLIQRYRLMDAEQDGEHLIFVNAFGVQQHIYFPQVEMKMQSNKKQARINGLLKNYDMERVRKYEGAAQMISPNMEDVYEDFLMSKYVLRQSDHALMVIESGEIIHNSTRSVSGAAKASWREASPLAYFHPSQLVRTFDATFDQTFR